MSSVIKSCRLQLSGEYRLNEFEPMYEKVRTEDCEPDAGSAATEPAADDDHTDEHEAGDDLIADARAAAGEIVAAAEQEAEAICAAARTEARELVQDQRKAGFDRGFEQGLAEGSKVALDLERQAREALDVAERERQRVFTECRDQLVSLAIDIAEQLLQREIESSPEVVADMAEQAMAAVRESDVCSIRVNPRDLLAVEERKLALRRAADGVRDIDIAADDSLEPGELMLDTDRGQIDGTLLARIAVARDTLREVVHDDGSAIS